jgi:hypothetical protein
MFKIGSIILKVIYLHLLVSSLLLGQSYSVHFSELNTKNYPDLSLTISIENNCNESIKLGAGDITVSADSAEVSIMSLDEILPSVNKTNIIFAIDASRSIRAETLESIKSSISYYIEHSSNNTGFGIIAFHDSISIISEISTDKNKLLNSLDKLQSGGSITELYYAAMKSMDILIKSASEKDTRRIVFIFSDGKDEGQAYTIEEVIKNARDNDVLIFSVGTQSTVGFAYLRILERMSSETDGMYFENLGIQNQNCVLQAFNNKEVQKYSLYFSIEDLKANKGHGRFQISLKNNLINHTETMIYSYQPRETKGINWLVIIIIISIPALILASLLIYVKKRKKSDIDEIEKMSAIQNTDGDDEVQSKVTKSPEEPSDKESEKPKSPNHDESGDERLTVIAGRSAYKKETLFIQFQDGPLANQHFELKSGLSIGRAQNNSIVINNKTISRNHTIIESSGESYIIRDLGSSNGTFLNGRKITEDELKENDSVKIGNITFIVKSAKL